MRNNFDSIKIMKDTLPPELRDIIYNYAYGIKESTLCCLASTALRSTFMMPVPVGWKRLLTPDNQFRWRVYLRDIFAGPLDMKGVTETLRLMNWNSLRYKQSALSEFVKTSTKGSLRARLRRADQQRNVVHMIWHCLTCCSPSDFCVEAHKNDNYKRYCHVQYFDTCLSYYYPLNEMRRYSLKFLDHLF